MNQLYYGDNLQVLREHILSESVDLIYLDPSCNSQRDYNLLFKSRKGLASLLAGSFACVLSVVGVNAQDEAPLRLAQTIPLASVEGRIDHLAIDLAGRRLFVCALGNNSAEVIDLQKGARVHSITGLGSPQGLAYAPESGKLIVANDKGGACNIYDGRSFAPTGGVALNDDADNVRYDRDKKQVYVGYGNGGIAVIEPESGKKVRSIVLSGHPEAFVLEKNGPRIFVNVPTAHHVAVIDRNEARAVATWNMSGASANFPMAFDETHHRLFIGCRSPAVVVVLNSDSGALVGRIPIPGDTDDVFYDDKQHRLFAICGAGSIAVINQVDPDNYKTIATVATASGARTGLFVPELSILFVAVPHRGSQSAEVRRYAIQ